MVVARRPFLVALLVASCRRGDVAQEAPSAEREGGVATAGEPSRPPPLVAEAIGSALRVGGCSGVRISDRYVLTAAHCAFGYDGREERPLPLGSTRAASRVVEAGRFHPDRGELEDWVLLEAVGGAGALAGTLVATLPDLDEVAMIEQARAGTRNETIALWGATFPAPIVRTKGHPTVTRAGQSLITRGRVLRDVEYQERVALLLATGASYDDVSGAPFPALPRDAMSVWEPTDSRADRAPVVRHYWSYKRSTDPLWYHSADYSNGSSGGGFFSERTGHYLGLVPMGHAPLDRSSTYAGFGSLYRIDKICAESKELATLPACRDLLRSAR